MIINIENISKEFEYNPLKPGSLREEISNISQIFTKKPKTKFWALKDVFLTINEGDIVGLIGPNGAGKTTILKILARITLPTSGKIEIFGKISSLLEVGTGFHPELTGLENIFVNGAILGMRRKEISRRLEEIISFSGIDSFINTPIKHYSSGMQMRLAFSVAAHLDADILLIDEVLSVGDANFQKKCLSKMGEISNSGRTIIFVSHQLGHIRNLCTRGVYLNDGQIAYDGGIKDTIEHYLKSIPLNSTMRFPGKPLNSLSIKQQQGELIIEAEYNVKNEALVVPSLGFVIYDALGNPITGANPIMTGDHTDSKNYKSQGSISVKISQPKLLDGIYYLSIWFSVDGYRDLQFEDKCLSFEAIGMAKFHKHVDSKYIGASAISCKYNFS